MEPLVQTSSGFGPVNTKLNSITPTSSPPKARKTAAQCQTVLVDVPLKAKSQEDRHWNGYRDCISSQSMLQNYMNFKRTGAPKKLMQWNGGVWVQLSDEVLPKAKTAFLEKHPMVEIEVDGNSYIFDFFRMLQIDLSSGLQRSIAWIDVSDDCYFPKFFVDESLLDDDVDDCDCECVDDNDYEGEDCEGVDAKCDETPKIEIEIKIDTNNENNNNDDDGKNNDNDDNSSYENRNLKGCGKRKREARKEKLESEEDDTADSSSSNSENLKRQRLDGASSMPLKWPNARLLTEGEKAFSVVRDFFMNGMRMVDPGVRITSIHQFARMGPIEKARWEAFHKQMEMTQAVRGRSNTVFAWYGASRNGVGDILAHGFGWPGSRIIGPKAHGIGVYLSPARLPHVSNVLSEADDNGEKHLVLCRVILGTVEKVEAGSKQFHPSSLNVDSGVDDLVHPKWYVVWSTNMNTHILPECIVSYKCSDCQPGPAKGADFMNWIPMGLSSVVEKLFSKLQSSLPAIKVEELKALCMTFKARKMAKDLFIQQLKSVVGIELLRSAICELQCPN